MEAGKASLTRKELTPSLTRSLSSPTEKTRTLPEVLHPGQPALLSGGI